MASPEGSWHFVHMNCAVDTFSMLFQKVLYQGNILINWKQDTIVPVFKNRDKSKAENDRPISLTSNSCKLLEHIIQSNIIDHLNAQTILT